MQEGLFAAQAMHSVLPTSRMAWAPQSDTGTFFASHNVMATLRYSQ